MSGQRIRASTTLLAVVFVATAVLYILIRPQPTPAVRYVPAVPESTSSTSVVPTTTGTA